MSFQSYLNHKLKSCEAIVTLLSPGSVWQFHILKGKSHETSLGPSWLIITQVLNNGHQHVYVLPPPPFSSRMLIHFPANFFQRADDWMKVSRGAACHSNLLLRVWDPRRLMAAPDADVLGGGKMFSPTPTPQKRRKKRMELKDDGFPERFPTTRRVSEPVCSTRSTFMANLDFILKLNGSKMISSRRRAWRRAR